MASLHSPSHCVNGKGLGPRDDSDSSHLHAKIDDGGDIVRALHGKCRGRGILQSRYAVSIFQLVTGLQRPTYHVDNGAMICSFDTGKTRDFALAQHTVWKGKGYGRCVVLQVVDGLCELQGAEREGQEGERELHREVLVSTV